MQGTSGSEEVEEFTISDWDANPDRKRRRMTKEQALYGVFAASESDEEGASAVGARPKESRRQAQPVAFVAGACRAEPSTFAFHPNTS